MTRCPACGTAVHADASECPDCGLNLRPEDAIPATNPQSTGPVFDRVTSQSPSTAQGNMAAAVGRGWDARRLATLGVVLLVAALIVRMLYQDWVRGQIVDVLRSQSRTVDTEAGPREFPLLYLLKVYDSEDRYIPTMDVKDDGSGLRFRPVRAGVWEVIGGSRGPVTIRVDLDKRSVEPVDNGGRRMLGMSDE